MNQRTQNQGVALAPLTKILPIGMLLLAVAMSATGGRAATDGANPPSASHSAFSLLPKSFQKDPAVHMTVITEMTVDGGKLPAPTAARPMYYLSDVLGYHDEGTGYGEKKILPPEKLQAYLEKSLEGNHFLRADAAHPATLVMIYSWGSANKLDNRTDSMIDATPAPSVAIGANGASVTSDSGAASYFEEPADYMSFDYATRQNFLARAQLVGGVKFAHEVAETFKEQDFLHDGSSTISGLSPIELLEDRDPMARQLLEETMDDCYYVVVSAYDAYAMAHGHRRLLWQSKMTTNSAGVSMVETLPALIASGAPYFGHLMTQPALLQGRVERQGHVEMGLPMVMPDEPAGAPKR